jgi:uncharacterized membrane protein
MMTKFQFFSWFLLTLPILPVLDLLWLGVLMKDFYRMHLGHLMRADIVWPGAIAFYVLFTFGLMYFAVYPALAAGDVTKALFLGALFGFMTYMTYDLTNYATLTNWPIAVVVVDILWGTFLSATIATLSFYIGRMFA